MRPVKTIVNRVLLALGLLTLFVMTFFFIGFRWGWTPLPKPPAGVRIEPLAPSITPDEVQPDNGAFDYMKAVALMKARQWSKNSEDQIEAVTAGIISGDTNAIENTLIEVQPALDLVREGSRAKSCQMPLLGASEDTTSFGMLRELARLLVADGKRAEHNGNSARAADDYFASVKFGVDCSKGGALIQSLVGDAIVSMGTPAIRAWVLQSATSSNDIQAMMEKLNGIAREHPGLAEALRYELDATKTMVERQMFERGGAESRIVTRRAITAYFDAAYGELIQDAEKPFWQSNSRAILAKWVPDKPHWLVMLNRPIPRMLLGICLPATRAAQVRTIRADVELEATEVVCALKLYELAHGSPPETLSDLVPALLPSVPIDPFDAKPLRYRREGKEWVFWSVGSDMKDDSAAWHEYKYYAPGEFRRGGDIYFKSTEPQDDLAWELAHNSRTSSVKTSRQ
jgi:hypothetical protein